MITSISEEFWVYQYWCPRDRTGDSHWWPQGGAGKYDTQQAAEVAARGDSAVNGGRKVRAVFVTRTLTFHPTLDQDDDD